MKPARGLVQSFALVALKPRWLAAPLGAGLTLALLMGVVTLGIAISSLAPAGSLPGGGELDYGRGSVNRFSPLRAAFIQSVLGEVIPYSSRSLAIGPSPRGEADASPRRIVESHALTNDDFRNARVIAGIPYTARTNTTRASRENLDPSDCAQAGGTVWYRYTPTSDLALIAYTFGTDHTAALGVFAGSPGDLRLVRCQTNAGGNALVAFPAKAGHTYYFQITSPLGGGNLVFSLDPHGTTSLVSRSSSGEEANGGTSLIVSVSGDGRYVLFSSDSSNLVPGTDPRNCTGDAFAIYQAGGPCPQVYLRDRLKGTTELVSATPSGEAGDAASFGGFISANGRYIAYESYASNLVPDDSDGGIDLYVHDRYSRRTERIPATSSKPVDFLEQQYVAPLFASISDDGRYVVFDSWASDLVEGDNNSGRDVFVYDRETKRPPERVSVSSSGAQMTGRTRLGVLYPSISADGRYVEFMSDSPTLVPGDSNGFEDVFVHDRMSRTTERVSVSMTGGDSDGPTWVSGYIKRKISSDGRYVAFASSASNLVPADHNNGPDVFIRDRFARTTTRVTAVSSASDQPPAPRGAFWSPNILSISRDGRYLAFDSNAANIAPGDSDQDWDVFLYDQLTRTTTLVTLSASGEDLSGQSPAISADARVVAYLSGGVVDRESDFYRDTDIYVYEAPRLR